MAAPQAKGSKSKRGDRSDVRLRLDGDDPTDLLHGISSKVTSTFFSPFLAPGSDDCTDAASARRRKPGQDASHFKTDEVTGKMVIDDEDSETEVNTPGAAATHDVAGSAYREGLTSVDGFTRGQNGKVKFNKDTKKRRRQNEDEDIEMEDGEAQGQGKPKKAKKKAESDFGKEFKAKKAGGDIKKKGVDPYAYLTLAQAAKKKGGKIGVAGKR